MPIGWLVAAIALNVAAATADIHTTQECLRREGARETNPIMQGGRLIPVKVSITVTFTGASIATWRAGFHKKAIIISVVPAVISTGAAINTARVCRGR